MANARRPGGRKLSKKARTSFESHARNYVRDAAGIKAHNAVMRESSRRFRFGDPAFQPPELPPIQRAPVAFPEDDPADPPHKRGRR